MILRKCDKKVNIFKSTVKYYTVKDLLKNNNAPERTKSNTYAEKYIMVSFYCKSFRYFWIYIREPRNQLFGSLLQNHLQYISSDYFCIYVQKG